MERLADFKIERSLMLNQSKYSVFAYLDEIGVLSATPQQAKLLTVKDLETERPACFFPQFGLSEERMIKEKQ